MTDTRQHIVTAASKLFYSEGIRAVSLDAVAQKAGVTKKTLYYYFQSKDDLIEGYLIGRDQPNLLLFEQWFDEEQGPVWAKVRNIFMHLAESARHPKWKGCGFLRTAAELANMPGHPAMKVGAEHKKKFEKWMAERLQEGGATNPSSLARQVLVLLDGTFSTMLVHRDASYAEQAGDAAAVLIRAALPTATKPSDNKNR
jgi:AcrR family transcriptional regulator